jgi:hypothetical protein
MSVLTKTFTARPSALAYMLRAFWPSAGWNSASAFPDMRLTWRGFRIQSDVTGTLRRLIGGDSPGVSDKLCLLAPHVAGFRLLMAALTDPAWPLPIWRALQVRNRLQLHRAFEIDGTFDLVAAVSGWRVLDKGIEVDLRRRLLQGETCVWESVVTFYYRGRFGAVRQHGDALGAAPASPVLGADNELVARWQIDGQGRWHFGSLTGDYNGIHMWNWYAHRLGFAAAFAHPQRVAAQCLAHLPLPGAAPVQLDLWIKGTVFFCSEVLLRQAALAGGAGQSFALWLSSDTRPAFAGTLSKPTPA